MDGVPNVHKPLHLLIAVSCLHVCTLQLEVYVCVAKAYGQFIRRCIIPYGGWCDDRRDTKALDSGEQAKDGIEADDNLKLLPILLGAAVHLNILKQVTFVINRQAPAREIVGKAGREAGANDGTRKHEFG